MGIWEGLMYNTHDRDLWLRFRKPMYNVYDLNHLLDAAQWVVE